MCRSIKQLRNPEQAASAEELSAAALQFVRKISGFHKPSRTNQAAFDQAVSEIAASSRRLLEALEDVRRVPTRAAQAPDAAIASH